LPYENEQHGMFTYFLLKKLKESKGKTTYVELADFIEKNVAIESLRVNQKEQDPQIMVSPDLSNSWQIWTFAQ